MQILHDVIDRLAPAGSLRKNASILAGGTILAQGVAFAVTPLLTRLYRVSDFGYAQVFVSIVALLLVIATGRYELSIPLPEDDRTAVNLLVLSCLCVLGTSLAVLFVVLIIARFTWARASVGALTPHLWLLAPCLAGAGCYQSLSYWTLRKKQFAVMARTRVLQVSSRFLIQLLAGLLHAGLPGLLIGETVARANGMGSFLREFSRSSRTLLNHLNWKALSSAAHRYRRFPLVSSVGALFNSAAAAVPSLLLVAFFGTTVTGWFALVDRVLAAPSVLIGQSLQQVYLSQGASLVKSDPRQLKILFERILKKIYLLPSAFCFALLIFGPKFFASIFGPQWREAGEYARILVFAHVVGFLTAPIDMTLTMLELQSWQFAWDVGRLLFVSLSMFLAHAFGMGPRGVIAAYSASMLIGYAIHILTSYLAINRLVAHRQTNARQERSGVPIIHVD